MTTARISPTAHYTGHVWLQNGLSDPAFATREGEWFHHLLSPFMLGSRVLGGPTIDGMLLARHRLIDHLLERELESGAITQVVEIAAGLSPRGWRMSRRYPEVHYVEADLPGMIAKKREVLARAAPVGAHHDTAEINALADDGPTSLAAIVARLDPARGTAIITEGLLNYFPAEQVVQMWRRFGAALAGFSRGLYLADLNLVEDASGTAANLFRAALGTFVRGNVHLDFHETDARRELERAGFATAMLHRPGEHTAEIGDVERAGARRVRIVEARR